MAWLKRVKALSKESDSSQTLFKSFRHFFILNNNSSKSPKIIIDKLQAIFRKKKPQRSLVYIWYLKFKR